MDCPACKNVKLVLAERQSIEIDYCPNCRGVWLDRGELDKLIDRSAAAPVASPPAAAPYGRQEYAAPPPQRPAYPQNQHPSDQSHPHYKKKKREGFLGELFDFD